MKAKKYLQVTDELKSAAIALLKSKAAPESVSDELGLHPRTVSKWDEQIKQGKKLYPAPGRPKTSDFVEYERKQALMNVYSAKTNVFASKAPFLAAITRNQAQAQLQKFRICVDLNTISSWLKKFGWNLNIVPDSFVSEYRDFVASLSDEAIEELARNRSRIVPRSIYDLDNFDPNKPNGFHLNSLELEDDDHEGLDDCIYNQCFLPTPLGDDPWDGEPLSKSDITDHRAALIEGAIEKCFLLFAYADPNYSVTSQYYEEQRKRKITRKKKG